jgi:hypothetical protein
MSVYPGGLDDLDTGKTDWTGDPAAAPSSAIVTAAEVNKTASAVENIQAELGVNPSGSSVTVAARLTVLDSTVAGKVSTVAGESGDVTGAQILADAAVAAALAGKANASHVHSAADIQSGTLGLARGGTGGTDAATARTSLGLNTAATQPATAFAPVAAVTTALGSPSTATTGTLVAGQMALADATSAPLDRTLPAANSVPAGTVTGVKKIDGSANAVTVSRAGADTITGTATGQTSRALTLAGESVEFTSDGASAWVITSTDTPSPALTATYTRPLGPLTAFLGDSIVGLGGSNFVQTSDAFPLYTCLNSGGRVIYGGTSSQSGKRTDEIIANGLSAILTASPKPARCVVLAGTNDSGQSIATSVVLANLLTIWTALRGAGIEPVACTIPPRGDSATANGFVDKYNAGIRLYAQRLGMTLVDFHAALVDVTSGGYKTNYCLADNVHPSWLGSKVMGVAAAAALVSSMRDSRVFVGVRAGDTTDLLAGLGLFRADTAGTANGYDFNSPQASTLSITTDADGTRWQRWTVPSTATGSPFARFAASSACSAGDVIELSGRVRTSGYDAGVTPTTGASYSIGLEIIATATTFPSAVKIAHSDTADGYFYIRGVAGAGATGVVRCNFQMSKPLAGSVWAEFGGVAVRNLTALGLASI